MLKNPYKILIFDFPLTRSRFAAQSGPFASRPWAEPKRSGVTGNQHHGCDCCEQEVIYLPAAFNSSPVLPSCLRRRSSEARPVCRAFSPRMGHGLLAGPLDSVSLGLRHLSDYKQLVGNQLAVMALMSGCYSLVSGRTKVPRTARWSDGYPGMAMSVFGFISSIPTVTASMAVTSVPQ